MADGIRAEVELADASECTVATVARNGADVSSVTRCSAPDDEHVTVQFTVDADADAVEAEEVFTDGERSVRRLTSTRDEQCVCRRVERHGCPIENVRTVGESVFITIYTADIQSLREILADVTTVFGDVSLRRVVRSGGPETDRDLAVVDRASLTDRQLEVLRTAHEMGYFAHGEGANATDVADALEITGSTFAEHLAAAQSKLMDELLDDCACRGRGGQSP